MSRPVDVIAALLETFPRDCTYDLLHLARTHRYGSAYTGLVTASEEPGPGETPERGPSHPCSGPGHLGSGTKHPLSPPAGSRLTGRDLLEYDVGCHVPNDAPQTAAFAGRVRQVAQALMEEATRGLEERTGPLAFSLRPMGSFVSDTKVGDMDEFDYLVVMDISASNLEVKDKSASDRGMSEVRVDICRLLLKNGRERERYHVTLNTAALRALVPVSSGPRAPLAAGAWVSAVYSHGLATCVELSWRCVRCHRHTTSIDLTLAILRQGYTYYRWLETLAPIPPPFHAVTTHPQVVTMPALVVLVRYQWRMSTCPLDIPMFDIAHGISPNIKRAFRILKQFTNSLLPKELKNAGGCRASSIVSSHALKMVAFYVGTAHPRPEDWEEDRLGARLADMLRHLTAPGEGDFPGVRDITNEEKLITGVTNLAVVDDVRAAACYLETGTCADDNRENTKSQPGEGADADEKQTGSLPGASAVGDGALTGSFPEVCADVIEMKTGSIPGTCAVADEDETGTHLGASADADVELERPAEFVYIRTAWRYDRSLHLTALARHGSVPASYVYPRPALPAPHRTHPLCRWTRGYLHSQHRGQGGADLREIPDTDLQDVWTLYACGLLLPADLRGGYRPKVDRLLARWRQEGVSAWTLKIDLSHRFPLTPPDPPLPQTLWTFLAAADTDTMDALLGFYRGDLEERDFWRVLPPGGAAIRQWTRKTALNVRYLVCYLASYLIMR